MQKLQQKYNAGLVDHSTSKDFIPDDFNIQTDYLPSPSLWNDKARSKALYYNSINQKLQANFDSVIQLSKCLFPEFGICEINFVDDSLQLNFGDNSSSLTMDKRLSICGHTVTNFRKNLFIPNLSQDWRFKNNPLLKSLGVKSYFGKAFQIDDSNKQKQTIGTLCFADSNNLVESISPNQHKQIAFLTDIIEISIKQWILDIKHKLNHDITLLVQKLEQIFERQFNTSHIDTEKFLQFVINLIQTEIETLYQKRFNIHNVKCYFTDKNPNSDILKDNFIYDQNCWSILVAKGSFIYTPNTCWDQNFHKSKWLICEIQSDKGAFDNDDISFFINIMNLFNFYKQSLIIKKLDEEKSKLLKGVSHGLRTPLHGILASCDIIRESDTQTSQSQIDIIYQCGKNLENIVNSLIDFYTLENLDFHTNERSTNLIKFQEDIVSTISLSLTDDCELLMSFDIDNEVTCFDSDLLKQVLLNCLNNSAKFTNTGYILFNLSLNNDILTLYVKDTGCGIDPLFLNKLKKFQPFLKQDEFSHGIGLGLYTSHQLITKINGTLDINNNLNDEQGVNVRIQIPCKQSLDQTCLITDFEKSLNEWIFYTHNFPKEIENNFVNLIKSKYSSDNLTQSSINCFYTKDIKIDVQFISSKYKYSIIFCKEIFVPLLEGDKILKNIQFCSVPFQITKISKCLQNFKFLKDNAELKKIGDLQLSKKIIKTLIVDDNLVNRNILAMFCKKRNLQFQLASNGSDALEAFKLDTYNLILMDFQMPGMSGIETIVKIRDEERKLFKPPAFIVMLTGLSDTETKMSCMQSGANDFYIKPLSLSCLDEIIRSVFVKT